MGIVAVLILYSGLLTMVFNQLQGAMTPSNEPWWVKIETQMPPCIYYFGPFASAEEAQAHEAGYVEDLQGEGASGLSLSIEQGDPKELTIYDEDEA